MSKTTNTPNKSTNKRTNDHMARPSKSVLVLMAVALMVASAGGAWLYQQSQIDTLETRLAAAEAAQVVASQKLAELQTGAEQPDDVAILYWNAIREVSTKYGSTNGQANGDASLILISFTAKNNGQTSTELLAADFDLKDADNNLVAKYADSEQAINAVNAFGLPKDFSLFTSHELQPGEDVHGTLVFWQTAQASDFEVSYNGESRSIAVNETVWLCDRDATTESSCQYSKDNWLGTL